MAKYEVMIIESRSAADIFEDRGEGKTLQNILKLEGVNARYAEAADIHHFRKAIKKAASENVRYVHFSGHGEPDGFCVNDTLLSWKEFDEICWPVLKGKCVCFSSCSIAAGVSALFDLHKTFCNAVVAPTRDIYWGESLVAFSAFYHKALNEETSTESDVRVMNHIAGAGTFRYIPSPSNDTTYTLGS